MQGPRERGREGKTQARSYTPTDGNSQKPDESAPGPTYNTEAISLDDMILVYWEDTCGCGWGLIEPQMVGRLMKWFVGTW